MSRKTAISRWCAQPKRERVKYRLHPLIHTRLGFALAQDDRSRRKAQGTRRKAQGIEKEVRRQRSEVRKQNRLIREFEN